MIHFIIERENKAEKFAEALQKYAGQSDFTGFFDNISSTLANWLEGIFEPYNKECGGVISWWLWDCPERGRCKDEEQMTIWDRDEEKKWVLKTPEDLYDYLIEVSPVMPEDTTMQMIFNQQTEGTKFAIKILDDMQMKNISSDNPGVEDRDALLRMAKNKIRNDYMIETGGPDPAPDFPLQMRLVTRRKKDDAGK